MILIIIKSLILLYYIILSYILYEISNDYHSTCHNTDRRQMWENGNWNFDKWLISLDHVTNVFMLVLKYAVFILCTDLFLCTLLRN